MEMILWCVFALVVFVLVTLTVVYLYLTQLGKGLRPRTVRETVNLLRWMMYG